MSDLTAEPPTYRPFTATVLAVTPVGPSFRRLQLGGPGMAGFGIGGADQRIKLVLPRTAGGPVTLPDDGSWYTAWLAGPEPARPILRTYTVRASRPGSIDVDVLLNGASGGPAGRWAAAATPGEEVVLIGPDRSGSGRPLGVEWAPPPDAQTLLLAGDETAVPAICAVLAELGPDARGTALLEVPDDEDVLAVPAPAGMDVRWLPRSGGQAHGAQLTAAVRSAAVELDLTGPVTAEVDDEPDELLWDVPAAPAPSRVYAWLAGEAGMVRGLRRHLVGEVGLPRDAVAFMGYWRAGRAG